MTIYAQGDILIIRRDQPAKGKLVQESNTSAIDPPRGSKHGEASRKDGVDPVILAEGEVTGHHHSLWGRAMMYRDDAMASAVPSDLYIGSVKIEAAPAKLTHPEHDTIMLEPGDYEIRGQRENHVGEARRVQD